MEAEKLFKTSLLIFVAYCLLEAISHNAIALSACLRECKNSVTICDKTGNLKMFSLSRAVEILSQYLVLRTDILKKTVVECTCFKGKTPYYQNSIINVLKSQ